MPDAPDRDLIGTPFAVRHADAAEYLGDMVAGAIVAFNDPPWSDIAGRVPSPRQAVAVSSMEEAALQDLASRADDRAELVIGIGGGTAIDTAKYLAWATGLPAVYLPTIASVDATFTDAVGVRRDRRVAYVGNVTPREVVIDLPLITSAPPRLNRAGIGDILSCHTGLHDWRLAADAGHGAAWDESLATLGRTLLDELAEHLPLIRSASPEGVAFCLDAYRRIGAACAFAGHSRFEEGSEHFLAYAIEEMTGAHYVHGELVGLGVVAMSVVQGNDSERASELVRGAGTLSHPDALGLSHEQFATALSGLGRYVEAEGLDYCVASAAPIGDEVVEAAWQAVCGLPGHERVGSGA